MFPPHDPYHILVPNISRYHGYNVELSEQENNPAPRQRCSYCNEITDQLNVILSAWRPFLQQVRSTYSRVPTSFDYNSRFQKGIYMLAYFPFYIEPIYYTLENFINDFETKEKGKIIISILGGGALPELIGMSKLIDERRNDIEEIEVKVFDKFQNWNAEIENCTKKLIPSYFSGEIFINLQNADLVSLNDAEIASISNSDIVVLQNTINDLNPNNYHLLKNMLASVWDNFERNSLMVIIDLNFNEVKNFMQSLQNEFERNGIVISPLNQFPIEHQPNIPFCFHLERILFSNQTGLMPRRRVNYYRFVMKKYYG